MVVHAGAYKDVGMGGFLGLNSQPGLCGKFQANERSCLRKRKREGRRKGWGDGSVVKYSLLF